MHSSHLQAVKSLAHVVARPGHGYVLPAGSPTATGVDVPHAATIREDWPGPPFDLLRQMFPEPQLEELLRRTYALDVSHGVVPHGSPAAPSQARRPHDPATTATSPLAASLSGVRIAPSPKSLSVVGTPMAIDSAVKSPTAASHTASRRSWMTGGVSSAACVTPVRANVGGARGESLLAGDGGGDGVVWGSPVALLRSKRRVASLAGGGASGPADDDASASAAGAGPSYGGGSGGDTAPTAGPAVGVSGPPAAATGIAGRLRSAAAAKRPQSSNQKSRGSTQGQRGSASPSQRPLSGNASSMRAKQQQQQLVLPAALTVNTSAPFVDVTGVVFEEAAPLPPPSLEAESETVPYETCVPLWLRVLCRSVCGMAPVIHRSCIVSLCSVVEKYSRSLRYLKLDVEAALQAAGEQDAPSDDVGGSAPPGLPLPSPLWLRPEIDVPQPPPAGAAAAVGAAGAAGSGGSAAALPSSTIAARASPFENPIWEQFSAALIPASANTVRPLSPLSVQSQRSADSPATRTSPTSRDGGTAARAGDAPASAAAVSTAVNVGTAVNGGTAVSDGTVVNAGTAASDAGLRGHLRLPLRPVGSTGVRDEHRRGVWDPPLVLPMALNDDDEWLSRMPEPEEFKSAVDFDSPPPADHVASMRHQQRSVASARALSQLHGGRGAAAPSSAAAAAAASAPAAADVVGGPVSAGSARRGGPSAGTRAAAVVADVAGLDHSGPSVGSSGGAVSFTVSDSGDGVVVSASQPSSPEHSARAIGAGAARDGRDGRDGRGRRAVAGRRSRLPSPSASSVASSRSPSSRGNSRAGTPFEDVDGVRDLLRSATSSPAPSVGSTRGALRGGARISTQSTTPAASAATPGAGVGGDAAAAALVVVGDRPSSASRHEQDTAMLLLSFGHNQRKFLLADSMHAQP
jgi:hypothetical protein